MAKVLVLFAHPALEKSRVHSSLLQHIGKLDGVHVHDLYEAYPDFDIDVQREQSLLLGHDIIVWQHPFYWYSSPALVKQWQDLVLEHNWAYGSEGKMLHSKWIFNSISCGGRMEAYHKEGRNRFTIPQLLAPFEQTARLCNMNYLPPFVIAGTHRLNQQDIELYATQYAQLLLALAADRFSLQECNSVHLLNELVPIPEMIQSL